MDSYVWSVSAGGTLMSANGSNTIDVRWDGVGAENLTVSYIDLAVCNQVATTINTVTLNALPAASIISGSNSVCLNSSSIYSVPAGMSEYIWTVVGGTGTSSTESINVTWKTVGLQSISVSYRNVSNCWVKFFAWITAFSDSRREA